MNAQYEFLPRLCKTLFVCQSRNAERSANRVDCAFKTVDLEQIQVQTAAVAFRFVRLVKIRQKFQFKKKMTGAKFRRIITFPTVAKPFWKHDQIFAVRISQIAVFEIVPYGRIRAVQQILIAPPAAVFLPHKIEGKRQTEFRQVFRARCQFNFQSPVIFGNGELRPRLFAIAGCIEISLSVPIRHAERRFATRLYHPSATYNGR